MIRSTGIDAGDRVLIVSNPRSGRGQGPAITARVVEVVGRRGAEAVRIEPAGPEHVASAIAAAGPANRIVLIGGDGLIHRALPALVETQMPVGIVGAGTGNDLARALGLRRRSVDDAIEIAMTATPSPVDVMTASLADSSGSPAMPDSPDVARPGHAASVITGGFSADVNEMAEGMRFAPGPTRYTLATVRLLPRLQPRPVTITLDGARRQVEVTLIAVANTRFFGGGMAICPGADPTDSTLDVATVAPTSPLVLAAVLPAIFLGLHVHHPAVTVERASAVEIDADFDLWADGEPFHPGGGGPLGVEASASIPIVGASPRA